MTAAKGMTFAPAGTPATWPAARASSTMDRPSGVSSPRDAMRAASGRRPVAGTASVAVRLPKAIVPVLSRSGVSMSPAASTARPDVAGTLTRRSRSMPAMPTAERSPPIVVG